MNRSALLALVCAALCAAALAACGEADDPPDGAAASALEQTFGPGSAIDDGRLTASFQLDPDGLLALGGPIRLRATGPFAAPSAGELPRFDLAIAAAIAGHAISAGASSTGERAFVRLGGRDYEIEGRMLAALRRGLRGAGAKGAGFALLGLDPLQWIRAPREKGGEAVGGIDTTRISGGIDVARLLADIAELLDGATGASGAGGLLTPKLREQIAAAVKSARVDVWTGARDRILRQLAMVIDFAFEKGSRPPIAGLDGGTIHLRLRLDDVNATAVKVRAPRHARPLSTLAADGGIGALLGGVGAAVTGRTGSAKDDAAFLRCVTAAGRDSARLAACSSKLAP